MKENDIFSQGVSFKHAKLLNKYRHAWAEEALEIEGGKIGLNKTTKYIGASLSAKYSLRLLGFMVCCLGIILFRLFFVQIIDGGVFRAIAEGNRVRLQSISPERGIIFDKKNRPLVSNVAAFRLEVLPQDLPRNPKDRIEVLNKLSVESKIPLSDIVDQISHFDLSHQNKLILEDNLDYGTALLLYVKLADMPGVTVESGMRRNYLLGLDGAFSTSSEYISASHILGYVGKVANDDMPNSSLAGRDYVGKTGLEKYYEDILRGTPGRKKIEVDAIGKERSTLAVDPPQPGTNLHLSLDIDAQNYLELLVKKSIASTGKKKYAAIALNPNNGEIVAMVSWPAYNNNDFSGGISSSLYSKYLNDESRPLFDRAISGLYPPGSTAKLMVASAALQENVVTESTGFNSTGGLQVGDHFFKDWKVGGHGFTNVIRALAWSVNTYFYYVGGGYKNFVGLGYERLAKYFHLFKIDEKTGIDLPGEVFGVIPSPELKQKRTGERWYIGDTYNESIGQGDLLVTPLQVARWTSVIATGGQLITPHLAVRSIDPNTKTENIFKYKSERISTISDKNLDIVKRGMRECVLIGSCQMLKSLPVSAGGKTGTAQWSNNNATHAWFTAFAPYDQPEIEVTVLVEEGGEGSTVSMPIASNFLNWWFRSYQH